jgi:hypothetical protein
LAGGGAIGLILVPFIVAERGINQPRLAGEFKKTGILIMPGLADMLAVNLRRLGFSAKVIDGPGEVNNGKNTIAPDLVANDVDATLIVSPMTVGFVAKYGKDVTPMIRCEVSLIGRNKGLLYRGFHQTGGLYQTYQANAGWRIGFTDKTFANIDAVFADIPAAARSLRDAASVMAETIAADLRR